MQEILTTFFQTALQSLLQAVVPALFTVARIVNAVLAVVILVRCGRSLFAPQEDELWGVLRLENGTDYPLTHWENTIGRAKSCDVCVHFPSVSRQHANLCRSDRGAWTVYPIGTALGVRYQGQVYTTPFCIENGDDFSIGGVTLRFFAAGDRDELQLNRQRTKPGATVSRAGTLWLLTLFQALTAAQFIPALTADNLLPILVGFGGLWGAMWLLFIWYRLCSRTAFEAETLTFFLLTVGFGMIAAYSPATLLKELATVLLGMVLFLFMSIVLRSLPRSMQLRWVVAALAAGLLAFNLLFGQRIFGAKNWVSLGPISFQPSEFVKLAFVLVGSATLDRLFAKRNLIFTVLFSGFCIGCLALMSDFGTALVFFVAFLCIAFLRSGDLPSIVMVTAAAGVAGGIVLHFKPYIAQRFAAWRHVWEYTSSTGYQQSRTMSAIASGGCFGVGPENGWLKYLGAANTDLAFGVVGEEFGLIVALCCVGAIIILALFTLRCAATARSTFYTIASCAAVAILATQTALNVLGAVDVLPLTGVTFPFLSAGGSSTIACWGLLAYLKAADTRPAASFTLRLPKGWRRFMKSGPDEPQAEDAPEADITEENAGQADGERLGFFADRPDIPVEDIFGKGGDRA